MPPTTKSQPKRSRRRSSTKKLPDPPPTFFVDVDLGKRFFEALLADGRFGCIFHDQVFPQGTDDETWIHRTAVEGWIGISHDKKIRKQHGEFVRSKGARLIVAAGAHLPAKHAENFSTTFPSIERFIRRHSAPYMARLRQPTPTELKKLRPKGTIVLWTDW